RLDRRSPLVLDAGSAMREAISSESGIVAAGDTAQDADAAAQTPAHHRLRQHPGHRTLVTLPLLAGDKAIGALTLVRAEPAPFEQRQLSVLQQLAPELGNLLNLRRNADLSAGGRLGATAVAHWRKIQAHTHMRYAVPAAIALAAWLLLGTTPYEVHAGAELEGAIERVVVAPRDGFISSVGASAGDTVDDTQPLLKLETRELDLERQRLVGERDQLVRQHRELLAERSLARAAVIAAQIDETSARVDLVDSELARSELRAPFNGVIIEGELQHRLGAPVERGDVLLKIAPKDDYRIVLNVAESDIDEIEVGQQGDLRLSAMPGRGFGFTVTRITPVASIHDDLNTFRVEGQLNGVDSALRPGMRGIAQVATAERPRWWIWTHGLLDYLRMRWWAW
ncbi:MAG: HlyD family efflux transporter periplasmic adaptor subunit, partial [Gammaproteobacteria bacterium]|nr:HlyD family efflux transporter periplasmic adaptor subunit [Gammaproteobacteria bacterium]